MKEINVSIVNVISSGGESSFGVEGNSKTNSVYTGDLLVQSVLINGFLSSSELTLEISESHEVIRIMAFESQSAYRRVPNSFTSIVKRLATQYSKEHGNFLEAFVSDNSGDERQVLVYDRFIQNIIKAAFTLNAITFPDRDHKIDLSLESDVVSHVHLGSE